MEIARHHQLIVNNWVGDPPSLGSYAELWSDDERFDPCCVLSMRTAAGLVEALRDRMDALDDELGASSEMNEEEEQRRRVRGAARSAAPLFLFFL